MLFFKSLIQIAVLLLFFHSFSFSQNMYDTIRSVRMNAIANDQPLSLDIQWENDPGMNTYSLYKKLSDDTDWGNPLLVSDGSETNYLDGDVEEGELYEYRIIKQTNGDSLGYGYLFSGINYDPPQRKGNVLLLVESAAANFVADNLTNYMDVLSSEGWLPIADTISENASVQDVKSLILQYYMNEDSLTAVLLLGNIAVAHSGNINPDAHVDHKGAWPADVYYGDVDGIWTDETVNNTTSAYPRVHNVPGDGNFDQDFIPGEVELAIGRMDFSELPIFDMDEYELLNNYLQKNIEFRTGIYQPRRWANIRNLNPWTEGLAQNGIRNYIPMVTSDSVTIFDFQDAFDNSYLFSYGGCAGSMVNSFGLAGIADYAENNFQVTFTAFFGSYYGDYDYENNYLRTVLASGRVLSTAWVGAPNWYFYPMAMGMDLSFCTLMTQNNVDEYYPGLFAQYVTVNLLGDPTLRAFIVAAPENLIGLQIENHIQLNWSPSSEDDIMGYEIYKKTDGMDYFELLNDSLINNTSFIDSCILGNTEIAYLVKAVKLEVTPSGSFLNRSSGPILNLQTTTNILPEAGFDLFFDQGVLSGNNLSTNANIYQWILPDGSSVFNENFSILYDEVGEVVVTLIASNDCYSDTIQQSIIITDVNDLLNKASIYIYPNPAKDFFNIETIEAIDEVQVFKIDGSNVFKHSKLKSGINRINIQNLEPGTYLIKVRKGSEEFSSLILINQ